MTASSHRPSKSGSESKEADPPSPEQTLTAKGRSMALWIALLAAALFSTKPIIIKWLYDMGAEPLSLMWLRLAIALPFYLVVGLFALKRWLSEPEQLGTTRSSRVVDIAKAAAIGLLGYYLASLLDLYGLQYVSAQLERLVLYAYPSLVVLLGIFFFGQGFNPAVVVPLALTYSGVALMYGHDLHLTHDQGVADTNDVSTGTLLIIGSALAFALYLLFSKSAIKRLGSLLFTSIAMTSATLATLANLLVQEIVLMENAREPEASLWMQLKQTLLPDYDSPVWLGILTLSLLATVLPSFLVSYAIKQIGPEKTSMSGTLGPVITTLLAVLLLGESFSWLSAAGMLLVIAGIWKLSKVK